MELAADGMVTRPHRTRPLGGVVRVAELRVEVEVEGKGCEGLICFTLLYTVQCNAMQYSIVLTFDCVLRPWRRQWI